MFFACIEISIISGRLIRRKYIKIKRILAFLAGMLLAISAVWITNQLEQVSASVFQKTSVPKNSAALGMAMLVTEKLRHTRLRVPKLI